ncbi:hypothetical protein D3C71_1041510 [compost metagenome]
MALVVKAQLGGDEAQARHIGFGHGRQVQARHGPDALHACERAEHRRQRQHAPKAARHLGMVFLQRGGGERRRLQQQFQLFGAQPLGRHGAAQALGDIEVQGRVVSTQRGAGAGQAGLQGPGVVATAATTGRDFFFPGPGNGQRIAPAQRHAHRGAACIHKQAPRGCRLLQCQQAYSSLQHTRRRAAVGRVVAHAARHGTQQLQQLAVCIRGAVIHRLAGSRLGPDGLGLGPAAGELGVGHHGLDLQLWRAIAQAPDGGEQVEVTLRPVCPCASQWRRGVVCRQIPVVQPTHQAGLGLCAGLGGNALLHSLQRLRGLRCRGRTGGRLCAWAHVQCLQRQGYGVFAVFAHRAGAFARPGADLAVGRQHQLYRQRVRLGLGALHFAADAPDAFAFLFNVDADDGGLPEKSHTTRPSALVAVGLQRAEGKGRSSGGRHK